MISHFEPFLWMQINQVYDIHYKYFYVVAHAHYCLIVVLVCFEHCVLSRLRTTFPRPSYHPQKVSVSPWDYVLAVLDRV